jgi:hypothetical protein
MFLVVPETTVKKMNITFWKGRFVKRVNDGKKIKHVN